MDSLVEVNHTAAALLLDRTVEHILTGGFEDYKEDTSTAKHFTVLFILWLHYSLLLINMLKYFTVPFAVSEVSKFQGIVFDNVLIYFKHCQIDTLTTREEMTMVSCEIDVAKIEFVEMEVNGDDAQHH